MAYVDTKKQVGDRDHLKVFANSDLVDEWFVVNDPEGVVFEYDVIGVVDDASGPPPRDGSVQQPVRSVRVTKAAYAAAQSEAQTARTLGM